MNPMNHQRRILRIQRRNSLYAAAFWSGTLKLAQLQKYKDKQIPILAVDTLELP